MLNKLLFIFISIFLITSCVQKQEGSTFGTLGKIPDGDLSFSFSGSSGLNGIINEEMNISPSKLTSINSSITNCRVKPGTTALPTGFSVNPITCAITGVPTGRIDNTTYTIEVTNSKGKIGYAQVTLNAKTYYSLSGTVTGLPSGKTLTISNGVDTLVQSSNGSFYLQSILQGSSFNVLAVSGDASRFTCSVTNGIGTANANISNLNITCTQIGTRVLSGTLSGLLASTQVIISTNGNSLTLTSNGTFNFPAMNYNTSYNVAVVSATGSQTCLAAANTGTLNDDIGNVSIVCQYLAPNYYSLIGTVSGLLSGQSVTINNGGDSKTLLADGTFSLNSIQGGTTYSITTTTGTPSMYSCTVTNGSGTISNNVTNIQVNCAYSGTRSISGTISGLTNGALVGLTLNGVTQSNLTNGSFSFNPNYDANGFTLSKASVTTGYDCNLSTTSGSLVGNTSGISVVCGPLGPYTVSITVSGINSGTISIANNSSDSLISKTNGTYTFGTQLFYGQNYNLTFTSAPTGHTCVFNSSSGVIGGVTTLSATCTPQGKTLGGTFSGIDVGEVATLEVSSLNGTNSKTLNGVSGGSSTNFSFDNTLQYGQNYNVKIVSQPNGKICNLSNGSGQMLGNVNSLSIICSTRAVGDCSFGKIIPWSANSTIRALACDGEFLYVGGDFTSFGPTSYNAALIDSNVAHPIPDSRMPELTYTGKVLSDGSGGWYVKQSSNLLHLKSDLSIDPNFTYGIGSYTIVDFEIDGDSIYVATTRSSANLLKINRFTGASDSNFIKPTLNNFPQLITLDANFIYVAGRFSTANSLTRKGLVRFNKITGTIDTTYAPMFTMDAAQTSNCFSFYSLENIDNQIYLSSSCAYVNGIQRNRFARINSDGSLDSLELSPDFSISTIKKIGSYVYVGGNFSVISGQSAQKYFVKYAASDFSLQPAELTLNNIVTNIAYDETNSIIYLTGQFSSSTDLNGLKNRKYLLGYNTSTHQITNLNPDVGGLLSGIDYYGGKIFITGSFSQVYNFPINNLARLKLSDGTLDQSFIPNIGGSVYSLIYDSVEDSLLIGGSFISAFNSDKYLTKLDLITNNKMSGFSPINFNNSINQLVKNNNDVYVVGNFTTANAAPMNYLGKFNFVTGAIDSSFLNSQANNTITQIAVDSNNVYLMGNFTSIQNNTIDAKYLAALDLNGNLRSSFFNIFPNGAPGATGRIKSTGNNLFVFLTPYNDYTGDTYSESGANYSLSGNSATLNTGFPTAGFSSSSAVASPDNSSAYSYYSGLFKLINLTTGSVSDYLTTPYTSGSGDMYNVNSNVFYVDPYNTIHSIK